MQSENIDASLKCFTGILMMQGVGEVVSQSRIWRAAGSCGRTAIPRQLFTLQILPRPKASIYRWPTGEWRALSGIQTLVVMMNSLIVKVCRRKRFSLFLCCVVYNDMSNMCDCSIRAFE
jgi:hypothetical protein